MNLFSHGLTQAVNLIYSCVIQTKTASVEFDNQTKFLNLTYKEHIVITKPVTKTMRRLTACVASLRAALGCAQPVCAYQGSNWQMDSSIETSVISKNLPSHIGSFFETSLKPGGVAV